MLHTICSITEMESNPIASFLRSMYKQKNLYQVYNSSCTQKGGCKLFKFVSIKVYDYNKYIYIYIYNT